MSTSPMSSTPFCIRSSDQWARRIGAKPEIAAKASPNDSHRQSKCRSAKCRSARTSARGAPAKQGFTNLSRKFRLLNTGSNARKPAQKNELHNLVPFTVVSTALESKC